MPLSTEQEYFATYDHFTSSRSACTKHKNSRFNSGVTAFRESLVQVQISIKKKKAGVRGGQKKDPLSKSHVNDPKK